MFFQNIDTALKIISLFFVGEGFRQRELFMRVDIRKVDVDDGIVSSFAFDCDAKRNGAWDDWQIKIILVFSEKTDSPRRRDSKMVKTV